MRSRGPAFRNDPQLSLRLDKLLLGENEENVKKTLYKWLDAMIQGMFHFWTLVHRSRSCFDDAIPKSGCQLMLGGGGGGGGGGGVTFAYGLNTPKMERGLIDVGTIDYKRSRSEIFRS